ncbi:MAG: phosphorylase family protein [Planctomycetota bacterium]|jgi:adenosylhomocysteine nucleosidase
METICVLGALGMELKGIGRHCESLHPHPDWARAQTGRRGGRILHLIRTGVGNAAGRAAEKAVGLLAPDILFTVGTAGGLAPPLKIGDVIAVEAIRMQGEDPAESLHGDRNLLALAVKSGAKRGSCLTVPKPLSFPEEKAEAGRDTGALVCEMEAWFVAEAVRKLGVPFLALKAVSDTVKDRLPDVRRFMEPSGEMDGKKFAAYLALHPDEAARSARFVRNAKRAMALLAECFVRMIASPGLSKSTGDPES